MYEEAPCGESVAPGKLEVGEKSVGPLVRSFSLVQRSLIQPDRSTICLGQSAHIVPANVNIGKIVQPIIVRLSLRKLGCSAHSSLDLRTETKNHSQAATRTRFQGVFSFQRLSCRRALQRTQHAPFRQEATMPLAQPASSFTPSWLEHQQQWCGQLS